MWYNILIQSWRQKSWRKESYLSDEEFEKIFKMTKEEFENLKSWKKIQLKKQYRLFFVVCYCTLDIHTIFHSLFTKNVSQIIVGTNWNFEILYYKLIFSLSRLIRPKTSLILQRNAHIYSYVAMSREKDFSAALKECLDEICKDRSLSINE